jgi:hypothetical protein
VYGKYVNVIQEIHQAQLRLAKSISQRRVVTLNPNPTGVPTTPKSGDQAKKSDDCVHIASPGNKNT